MSPGKQFQCLFIPAIGIHFLEADMSLVQSTLTLLLLFQTLAWKWVVTFTSCKNLKNQCASGMFSFWKQKTFLSDNFLDPWWPTVLSHGTFANKNLWNKLNCNSAELYNSGTIFNPFFGSVIETWKSTRYRVDPMELSIQYVTFSFWQGLDGWQEFSGCILPVL